MMMTSASRWLLVAANLLIPVAILVFASGFFPHKPFLPGLAKYDDAYAKPLEAPFDKVIFMVVDALRSDFVYSEPSGFSFTQSLISDGSAMPFTAYATSPTITMPRIKAITTGSIPSFLDVILNFAESDTSSTLATQDTWLAQMKSKGSGKMIMFGDDTWLKLFPETFDRTDGTSSFFVADFTEVDHNVTRHIPEELKNDDWSTMVLHYLGLDHIGHKAGPRSPNMIPKQQEMDSMVQQIYESIEGRDHLENTLLVLCGDHGMNDAGNHGGSAPGETSTALVFISPKLKSISSGQKCPAKFQEDFRYYSTVEQSDIAPTLGGLLGFPVPRNNLGAFIVEFLSFWSDEKDRVRLLLENAKQILRIVTATFSDTLFDDEGGTRSCSDSQSDIEKLGCDWLFIMRQVNARGQNSSLDSEALLASLSKWSRDAQGIMSSTASNYNMSKLIGGQIFAIIASVLAFASAWPTISNAWLSACPILAVSLAYGIMMFASSYVEEEQNFWFWTASGWLAFLALKSIPRTRKGSGSIAIVTILCLFALRVIRRWNQTGQKFAGDPDIAHGFLTSHNLILWWLVGATYGYNQISLSRRCFPSLPRWIAATNAGILATLAFSFKLAFTMEDAPELMRGLYQSILTLAVGFTLLARAQVLFANLALAAAIAIGHPRFFKRTLPEHIAGPSFNSCSTFRTCHDLLTLFLLTQTRTINIPVFLLFELQFYFLSHLKLSLLETSTSLLLLQHASFFSLGGSNAISSIDLSSAYNGVGGYNVAAVGLLTLVGNWAGPIYWTSATVGICINLQRQAQLEAAAINQTTKNRDKWQFQIIDDEKPTTTTKVNTLKKNIYEEHLRLLTLFTTLSLVFVMLACTILRTHLFIWTVFSPKYLYSMAWAVGQHLLIDVGLGSLLWSVSSW